MRNLLGRLRRSGSRSLVEQLATLTSVGDGSTLTLDFTTGVLDPRLTFTRSSTATYIGADGLVKTMAAAPTNDPTKARFDYDPTTLAPRGLLIEGSASNIVFRSQQLNTSPWLNAGTMTVSETGSGSPANDATSNVVTWTNGTAAGNAWLRQSVPVSAGSLVVGSAYTWSVWLKARGNQRVAFWAILQGASGNREVRVDFSVSPPTVTSVAATGWTAVQAPSIQEFPNGWYRVTTGGTIPASTTGVFFGFSNSDAVPASGTNGFEAWGYQLESGSGASSYIPTGASQGTRNADNCSIVSPNFAPWFNASAGTLLVSARTAKRYVDSAGFDFPAVLTLDSNNHIGPCQWNGVVYGVVRVGGSYRINYATLASPGNNANYKAAIAYADSDYAAVANGGSIQTGSGTTVPSGLNQLALGASRAGIAGNFFGHISQIKFWPTRLPNAQLQSLTT